MAKRPLAISIDRPIADVFRVLTTPSDTPKWSSSAIDEVLTTPGRKVAMRSLSGPVPFEAAWSFSAVPGGTRVEWTWSFAFPAVLRLVGPAFEFYLRRSLTRDLDRLKAMMEAGAL